MATPVAEQIGTNKLHKAMWVALICFIAVCVLGIIVLAPTAGKNVATVGKTVVEAPEKRAEARELEKEQEEEFRLSGEYMDFAAAQPELKAVLDSYQARDVAYTVIDAAYDVQNPTAKIEVSFNSGGFQNNIIIYVVEELRNGKKQKALTPFFISDGEQHYFSEYAE